MATPSNEPSAWLKEILDTHPANRGVLDDLIEDLKRSGGIPLVPFIGAGLSQGLGLKGWGRFLLHLADDDSRPRIQELLDQGQYELAAQELEDALGRQAFHDGIRYAFGDKVTNKLTLTGAVTLLPKLARGPVITTNFDRVLERVFKEAQQPFDEVVWGAHVDQIAAAVRKNARYLLKLHGDAEERSHRILTLRDYEQHYNSGGLADILEGIYAGRVLLFLGCSLNQDRTVQVLTALAKRQPGMHHYAVMALETTQARRRALSNANIKVLWFPPSRHELLAPLLEHLIAHAPAAPAPQQPRLTLIPPTRGFETRAIHSDLDLLIPFRRTTSLLGRQAELDTLWTWLHQDKPVSVRLITGRGGAGKTRIAIELMLRLEAERPGQWNTGWLSDAELRDFPQRQNVAAWQWPSPTLAVIDYASSSVELLRPWLRDLAAHASPPAQRPLRILLLEREASRDAGWFESLLGHDWTHRPSVEALFDPCAPVPLQPIAELSDRRAILSAMLAQAARQRGVSPPTVPATGADTHFDQRLASDPWRDPVTLHMAALVAIDNGLPQALSPSRTDLADHLAGRELDRAARAQSTDPLRGILRHMAAYVTAAGGLPRAKLLEAAKAEALALGVDYPGGPAALADEVCRALPAPDGAAAILPDIVGEAALLRVFGGPYVGEGSAALCRAAGFAPGAVAASICRTTQDYAPAGREEPLSWIEALVREGLANDLSLLAAVADAMPDQTIRLREKAVQVLELLLDRIEEQTGQAIIPVLALLKSNLAVRLRDVGRRDDALARAQEAVELRRQLVQANPNTFLPGLATSLNNLATMLSDIGRRDDALASVQEAVGLYRQVAQANPDFRPNLAMSLNNLCPMLCNVGRRDDALVHAHDAVKLYRELAQANPGPFLHYLATSLNNLATILSQVGRRDDALAHAQESLKLRRQLAQANPDAFLPDLAWSLNSISNSFRNVGRRDDALAHAQEAVKLRRQLAQANPDAFIPVLATSLGVCSECLLNLERHAEAAAAAREGVALLREYFLQLPDAFRNLMRALLSVYVQSAEKAGLEPDLDLLAPILERLQPPTQES